MNIPKEKKRDTPFVLQLIKRIPVGSSVRVYNESGGDFPTKVGGHVITESTKKFF